MSANGGVVELEGVSTVYGQDGVTVRALDNVSLEIEKGDFAVLVGPSGSGKTTLLNMIGGLDTPSAGCIRVAGNEIGGLTRSELS